MRAELGWTPEATRAELWRFLQSRFEGQTPVLDGETVAQQELIRRHCQAGAFAAAVVNEIPRRCSSLAAVWPAPWLGSLPARRALRSPW